MKSCGLLKTAAVWIMEPVAPGLPRLARYGKIILDSFDKKIQKNFAMLIGVIR